MHNTALDSLKTVQTYVAGTSVPRPELISSPGIASFVGGEAIPVSPPPAAVQLKNADRNDEVLMKSQNLWDKESGKP